MRRSNVKRKKLLMPLVILLLLCGLSSMFFVWKLNTKPYLSSVSLEDLTDAQIKRYLPKINNFDAFHLTRNGFSPNRDYYLIGLDDGSPIPNREMMQGNWVINIKTNEADRLMRDQTNHLYVSAFYSWIEPYKIAFLDQLDTSWGGGAGERKFVVYDVQTKKLTPATIDQVLPPITEIKTYTNEQYGVQFTAPYREYAGFRTGPYPIDLCKADLVPTTDPAIVGPHFDSSRKMFFQGLLFDLSLDLKTKTYQVVSHDQDSGHRDACVTPKEYQEVLKSISIL